MLSVIGSVYDPLGMSAPFVLQGRLILQEMTRRQLGWDDAAPDDLAAQWPEWLEDIALLSQVCLPRCMKPEGFGSVASCELHHFSDASSRGYGVVTYLRFTNTCGKVHCSFVFGKSRLASLKGMTIPRLELTAAVLAARVRRALQFQIDRSVFWTDSTTVMRYVRNEHTRFHAFVANRVAVIRDASSPEQWRYVDSSQNPADDASRGQSGAVFAANGRWFVGPSFLWKASSCWPSPPRGLVVNLIIQSVHEEVGHSGREHVLSQLHSRFSILNGNSAVRRVLSRCISCRRRQGPFVGQKMADLPADRVTPDEPPFTNTGLDLFGVFYVKKGRGQEKRYGIVFSCLVSRAVHIEVVSSLSTDSFICALRRFLARRGQVRVIRSDRGTNFVGANNELAAEWEQLMKSEDVIHETMLQRKIDWIFNVPEASSHGGVWERVIRTIRKVLDALLTERVFTEETLTTLMCEVEAIVNGRPLTYVSSDKDDPQPLTPNDLLLAGGSVSVPVGAFRAEDLYAKRRWRQAQYMADTFWARWRKEYIPLLQQRQKALRPERSLSVGYVLIADRELPRCQWPLGRVVETKQGSDGLVRSVELRTRGTKVCRPVNELVLMCEKECGV